MENEIADFSCLGFPSMAKEIAEKSGWGSGGVPASEIANSYQEALASSQQDKVFYYH